MTAVTVTGKHEITGTMSIEVVKGTFTDGYTYESRYEVIDAVFVQSRSRTGAYASVSNGTITLHCSSASGDVFDLLIIGH